MYSILFPLFIYTFIFNKTGSNALHSRNGSDVISMLSKCYELRRPNKVSFGFESRKQKFRYFN